MLCSNRFEPAGHPSTCILDTALIPLPSFILIATLILRLALWNRFPNQNVNNHTAPSPGRQTPKWITVIYILLILAAFAMNVLQVARLVSDKQGVGLLPVTFVGLILTVAIYREPYRPYILLPFWLLWTIFEALDVARLHKLDQLHPAKGSMYPSSDRLLDNIVMLALYAVFALFEICVLSYHRHQHRHDLNPALNSNEKGLPVNDIEP